VGVAGGQRPVSGGGLGQRVGCRDDDTQLPVFGEPGEPGGPAGVSITDKTAGPPNAAATTAQFEVSLRIREERVHTAVSAPGGRLRVLSRTP
jgi:hypothetical protein